MCVLFRFIVVFCIVAGIEWYFLQGLKTISQDFSQRSKSLVLGLAYGFAGLTLLLGLIGMVYPPPSWPVWLRWVMALVLLLVLCKLLGLIFLILDDGIRLIKWVYRALVPAATGGSPGGISRLKFFSQLALGFTVIPAVGLLYGMIRGAYKYRIHTVRIRSSKIPAAFNGYNMVQISDLHCGSFTGPEVLERPFEMIQGLKPDLILFTGDLVNNTAEELKGFDTVLSKLKAKDGVFSVLGNHDYGDYYTWESPLQKSENLQRLFKQQQLYGWTLLMNRHVSLIKNEAAITLIGVENWGANLRFPKYGRLTEACKNIPENTFKILMSHDPSHWDGQVRREFPEIDLTLSGHTHGMQLGIEIPGLKWSPAQWIYKQWAGLYQNGNQYLYVNRGLGFLGYPGRLGIWPEITQIILESEEPATVKTT